MYESPRIRRLKSDLHALEKLKAESSVFWFKPHSGTPPQHYTIAFCGKSLARDKGKVVHREYHEVEIKLGASYPRTMPELRWLTPIYHPNISEIGMICLGAYGTHWVPSLALDELCVMLWDMARFQNYDIRSPYNRDAALWAANQSTFKFPMDPRPLRDFRTGQPRKPPVEEPVPVATPVVANKPIEPARTHQTDDVITLTENEGFIILDMEVDLRPQPVDPSGRGIDLKLPNSARSASVAPANPSPVAPQNLFGPTNSPPASPPRPPAPVQEDVIFLD